MNHKPLSPDASAHICKHMNEEHSEAVASYARKYGGIKEVGNAKMIDINEIAMILEVEGKSITIEFDHKLTSREDAHNTLVAMAKQTT